MGVVLVSGNCVSGAPWLGVFRFEGAGAWSGLGASGFAGLGCFDIAGSRGLRVEVLGLCGLGLFWVRGSEFWGVQGGSLLGRTF